MVSKTLIGGGRKRTRGTSKLEFFRRLYDCWAIQQISMIVDPTTSNNSKTLVTPKALDHRGDMVVFPQVTKD